MRSAFFVAAALGFGLACSSTSSQTPTPNDAATDTQNTATGCPAMPSALAACPAGINFCQYYEKVDSCGVSSCPCGPPATVGTNACASQDGCMTPTDNKKLCAPGLDCNEGSGCVLQWCGRSCVCGADKKYRCAPDGC